MLQPVIVIGRALALALCGHRGACAPPAIDAVALQDGGTPDRLMRGGFAGPRRAEKDTSLAFGVQQGRPIARICKPFDFRRP